ncbi:hypothetical protein, conserved [Trypanosoma brucei gambiense DAL972]|uniref:Uncharacterized protein n=1 Tax=Trypanosoma brucei gambiense (strain MHOM/CI/86/DAL972) TaxID=679716 RepID=C9ZLN0_TRYB9|nr:hypothetical protein, conserved [Trypanosoma brucei gambiense DAL972]CBH10305.1 hypothetical protein, conserved [Trypanosoma brucei gambiense DAL972]|eukprot:XP_011772595.1 hypothetical protein, conserved [Trypanosoma brucei gambiense DAL972]
MSEEHANDSTLRVKVATINDKGEEVYASSLSHDGTYLAAVFGDGALVIFNPSTFSALDSSAAGKGYDNVPCTAVQWLESSEGGLYHLVSVSSAGGVFIWQWDGAALHRTNRVPEKGNEITCLAVSPECDMFITAGSDRTVRLYDADGTLKANLQMAHDESGVSRLAHTSRIFSVRFVSQGVAVSGGWGGPLQVWDLKANEARVEIRGAQVSSDGIELITGTNCVLVASRRQKEQLQVFDCVSGQELADDSARLSMALGELIPLSSRLCKTSGLVWTITSSPSKVLVTSYSTGQLIASYDSAYDLMNISIFEGLPNNAYISCAEGKLLFATVKQ